MDARFNVARQIQQGTNFNPAGAPQQPTAPTSTDPRVFTPDATNSSASLTFTAEDCMDFMLAAKAGNLDKVQAWAAKGMRMDLRNDSSDQTPLGEAARKGHMDVVRFIIAQPTASFIAEADKVKALTSALVDKRSDIAGLILSTCKDQDLALASAVHALGPDSDLSAIRAELRKTRIEATTAPAIVGKQGLTDQDKEDFHASARNGDLAKVKQYLDRGMPPDVTFKNNDITALNHAARKGHQAVVELLLRAGAGSKACQKQDALIAAATAGHQQIAQILLDSFAAPGHIKDAALQAARALGLTGAVALIAHLQAQ